MAMDGQKLLQLLHFYNPWWLAGRAPESLALPYRRPVLERLESYLELDRAVIIKGPRRVGKSTLLYQMIGDLLDSGKAQPKDILYISFDDVEMRSELSDILEAYRQATAVAASGRTVYCFIDEVHFLPDWQFQVKRYLDRKSPVKFILSGSSATLVKRGAESLAGRTVEELVLPFSFREYVGYSLGRSEPLSAALDRVRANYDITELPDITSLLPFKTELLVAFEQYLSRGGFPHLFQVQDEIIWRKLLREDIVEKVIYRDLADLFQIKQPLLLEKIFLYLTGNTAGLLNISNLSRSFGLSRATVETYIDYLRQSYLVFMCNKYSPSLEARLRSAPKMHSIDCGLAHAFDVPEQGRIVESMIAAHLLPLSPLYWRDGSEVDIVLERDGGLLPVEVKYRKQAGDFKGIRKFADLYGCHKAVVVTGDELRRIEAGDLFILLVPAWLLSLLL